MLCAGGFSCYVRDDIMIKLICDKCGKDYTYESLIAKTSLTAPLLPTLFINATNDPRTLYLCNECAKQVYDYDFIFGEKPE